MKRPSPTSWKLKGDLTNQALTILRRVYKTWAPCLLEILEYSQEKKYLKCRVKVPKGDYSYTRVRPPYVTCIQHDHILAQLCILFFYFLTRDGVIEIFNKESDLQKVISFLNQLGFWAKREYKEIKKQSEEEQRLFLNKRAAEILIDLYLVSDEERTQKFERKVLVSEEFIVETWLVGNYIGPTKLPGLIFKMKGEYTRKGKTRECLLAEIRNTAYTKIFLTAP